MKKIISAVAAIALFVTGYMPGRVIGAEQTPEASEFTDYVRGEKEPNQFDASAGGGFSYLCINNNYSLDYTLNYAESVNWYVRDTLDCFTASESSRGFEGFEIGSRNKEFSFAPEAGKTYAVYARVKNDSKDGLIPRFGAAMNDRYSADTVCYTNEYGAEGMPLDADGWQDFKATITLRDDYAESGIYNNVFFGLPATGTQPKATAFSVSAAEADSVYIAPERAYDIEVTAGEKTVLGREDSITFGAKMLNQLEIPGGLSQKFEWYALNGSKTAFADKIHITALNDNASEVSVSWDSTIDEGNYIIAAKSADYDGFVRLAGIIITDESLCDRTAPAPANTMPDASLGAGQTYLMQRNNTQITYDNYQTSDETLGGYCFRYYYTGSGAFSISNEGSGFRGFGGFEINSNDRYFGFEAEAGKTYAISARVKNGSENGAVCSFGAAMNEGYSNKYIATNEYGAAGMTVGSEWTDFNATITLPANYNTSNKCASIVYMGMADKAPEGAAFWLDASAPDSVYLAEEKAVGIKLSKSSAECVTGADIDITADVVNQVGVRGKLLQELDWICTDSMAECAADGVSIIKTQTGARVHIENADRLKNGLKIIAVSKRYGLVSGIVIAGENAERRTIYVAENGDDCAEGTSTKPLATLAGARDRIRMLRANGENFAADVIFADGEYYFDNTVSFDSRDMSEMAVTYKAAPGARVVFSGAEKISAEAAPVSDSEVYRRLKEDVRDKVLEIDLSEIAEKLTNLDAQPTIQQLNGSVEYPQLYLNDTEQTLAQWPNGESEYSEYTYLDDTSIKCTEDDSDRWTEASGWWVGGYFNYDYQYMRLPATGAESGGRINLETDKSYSLYPYEGRSDLTHRWKAFNLLEELDTPTEWYIDAQNKKLYYYPPQNISGAELSVSVLQKPMIKISGADNIRFEGIEFAKTRGNAIEMQNSDNIGINNCRFSDIGVNAIQMNGSTLAQTDRDYWQRQYINAAKNCEISDCVFYNIGGRAAVVDGGNVDTLEAGNNVFKNNIITRCAQKIKNYEAILMNGCGNSIVHNNISRTAFQAIRFYGNDHVISYNEIYNVRQDSDDAGAVYCGRNTVQRGSVISYNYMHDLYSTERLNFRHQPAIYWDDGQTGQKAEYNIIRDSVIDVYTNGVDNEFSNNTIINTEKFANFNPKNVSAASNTNTDQTTFGGYIADENLYFSKYENLKTIVESSSLKKGSLAKYNRINSNLYVNAGTDSRGFYAKLYAQFNNNVNKDSFDGFVDAQNQDYRVKNSAKPSGTGALDESFDIDSIGIISDNAIELSEVKQISPQNYDAFNTSEAIHFMWDEVFGATSYVITVAADENFENIVSTQTVFYNFADITIPKKNDGLYYWKVTAQNTSREFSQSISSPTRCFANGEQVTATLALDGNAVDIGITNMKYTDGLDAQIYLAEYGGNNELCAVQVFDRTLPYGKKTQISDKIAAEPAQSKTVELMVWNNNSPLCKKCVINQ